MSGPGVDGLRKWAVEAGDSAEEPLLLCLEAAKEWFRGAGVPEPPEDSIVIHLYTLGVYLLSTYYYDNRSALAGDKSGGADAVIPFGVMSIRNQLQQFGAGGGDGDGSG